MNLKTKTHLQRYNAALALCEKTQMIAMAKGATIFYQGNELSAPFYQISEDGNIVIKINDTMICSLFVADSDYDEGCHTTISNWKTQFLNDVQLWKRIR